MQGLNKNNVISVVLDTIVKKAKKISHTDYKTPDLGRSLHHAKAINYLEHSWSLLIATQSTILPVNCMIVLI